MTCCNRFATLAIGKAGFHFSCMGVDEVSVEATETARRVLLLREEHRSVVTERLGYAAGNGHRVLDSLYEQPIVSVNDVRDIIGTTYPRRQYSGGQTG